MHEALEQWKKQSVNNTPNNTLIRCEIGKVIFYGWNLKPNDISEKDFRWGTEPTTNN
jgi:hypothetical protein